MHYKANWLLIVDNLSDFAHLAFVHTHTLGGSEEYAYKTKPVAIEKLDDGFRVERWHMNAEPPPYHKKVISNRTDKIDRRNIGRMIIPGIFLLDTMFAPAGKGAEKGVQVEGTRQYRNAQFMTPETRSSTHFFWNYLHDFDIDNPNIALSLRNSLEEAFNEDKAIIEAQQKVFDADPNYQLLAIGADAALTYFRWALAAAKPAERRPRRDRRRGRVIERPPASVCARLPRRDHHDLDPVLRRRKLGLDGGARRLLPPIPSRPTPRSSPRRFHVGSRGRQRRLSLPALARWVMIDTSCVCLVTPPAVVLATTPAR